MDEGGEKGQQTHIDMRRISVYFPENGVRANDGVDINFCTGEVHAIVGENGSGKSTLMHVLSGSVTPREGDILIDGRKVKIDSPRRALEHGLGMVHQHIRIVREMKVWENVVLGMEPRSRFGKINIKSAIEELEFISSRYNLDIAPKRRVGELGAEEMLNVALLTVLYHGASFIILDEPNSPSLDKLIRRLVEYGNTVAFITHKLNEALRFSDRVSVMRGGRLVAGDKSELFTASDLASLMMGEDYEAGQQFEYTGGYTEHAGEYTKGHPSIEKDRVDRRITSFEKRAGEKVMEIEGLSCNERGYTPIEELSLSVHSGEVVAVTGIRENGLETLEHVLAGVGTANRGTLRYRGKKIEKISSTFLRKNEVAYIPTDRLLRGASLESSVAENMILLNYHSFHSWGRLKRDEIEHYTGKLRQEYDIKGNSKQALSGLSGGNIQKVIISRELERIPKLVIFSEPSWGLDTRSRDFVLEKIELLAVNGSAVLILTSDLDEALELGDSIIALYRGRSAGQIDRQEANKNLLGKMVLGIESHPQGRGLSNTRDAGKGQAERKRPKSRPRERDSDE